jgi:hypothetical protein
MVREHHRVPPAGGPTGHRGDWIESGYAAAAAGLRHPSDSAGGAQNNPGRSGAVPAVIRLHLLPRSRQDGRSWRSAERSRIDLSTIASDIPAELLPVFVFGSAYVLRDTVVAREWWTRMESKKAARFNVDFWIASMLSSGWPSGYRWIEDPGKPTLRSTRRETSEGWIRC